MDRYKTMTKHTKTAIDYITGLITYDIETNGLKNYLMVNGTGYDMKDVLEEIDEIVKKL